MKTLLTTFVTISSLFVLFGNTFANSDDNSHSINLYYESGEYSLTVKNREQLDKLLSKLDRSQFYTFEILSFTDSVGSIIANEVLSSNRANQVRIYLETNQVAPTSISASALGESGEKKVNNKGLAQNRKTVVKLRQEDPFVEFTPSTKTVQIDPSRLNVITGAKGTTVVIPANTLVKKNGSPVYGVATFSLTEYYTKQDFLYGELHTTSDGKILESGGSLKLEATQNGNELKIKTGSQLQIKMPADIVKEDMQYFAGVQHEETHEFMDWELSSAENTIVPVEVAVDFQRAEENLRQLVNDIPLNENETQFLEFIGEPGNEVELGILLGNAIRKMDEKQIQLLVEKYELDMVIAGKEEDIEYFRASFSKGGRNFAGSGIVYRQSTKRVINLREETFEKYSFPSTDGVRFIKNEQEHVVVLTKQRLDFSSVKQVRNYIVSSGNLGWINCDRFLKSGLMLADVEIKVKSELIYNLRPTLVFKDINSVMPGQIVDNETIVFSNVPVGMDVSLFGFTAYDNQIFSISKDFKASGTVTEATVQSTTKDELIETIASLTY